MQVAPFVSPDPDCKGSCRFKQIGPMYGTALMYYDPIFTNEGWNVNPDINTNYRIVKCQTCDRKWQWYAKYNKLKLTELK